MSTPIPNFIADAWQASAATEVLEVTDPAKAETIARVPLSSAAEVDLAVQAAAEAFPEWRRTPVTDRVQFLLKLKRSEERRVGKECRSRGTAHP